MGRRWRAVLLAVLAVCGVGLAVAVNVGTGGSLPGPLQPYQRYAWLAVAILTLAAVAGAVWQGIGEPRRVRRSAAPVSAADRARAATRASRHASCHHRRQAPRPGRQPGPSSGKIATRARRAPKIVQVGTFDLGNLCPPVKSGTSAQKRHLPHTGPVGINWAEHQTCRGRGRSRECPANGGIAVGSDREMSSHLRRRMPRHTEGPKIGQSREALTSACHACRFRLMPSHRVGLPEVRVMRPSEGV
jgi:hypothetical protein